MKATLLQQAKKIKNNSANLSKITKEDIELALAWSKGEITVSQVAKVYGVKGGTVYCKLATSLKKHLLTN